MKYVDDKTIRDFYARTINTKPVMVWLRATAHGDWELMAAGEPARASLVGNFTMATEPKMFALDVQETAAEMVRKGAA